MNTKTRIPGGGRVGPLRSRCATALLMAGAGAAFVAGPLVAADSGPVLSAERLMFVDCLLPGSVTTLGRSTFLGRRHPVRTTVDDCEIRGGEYVSYDRSDYATALQIWLPAAQQGDEQAEIYVGEMYEKGLGTTPDYAVAAQWYSKAAQQKSAVAMIHLAYLYEQGLGVARDPVRALNLYRASAGLTTDELTFASDVTAANSRIAELTAELEGRTQALSELAGQLDQTRERLAVQQAEAAQDKRATETLRTQLTRLESLPSAASNAQELTALRTQLKESESKVAEQGGQIALLEQSSSQQNAELTQRLAALEREDGALKAQLGGAAAQAATARSQLAAAQARQVALEQEVSRRRTEADQNEQALHKAEEELRNRPPPSRTAPDPSVNDALAAARIEVERQRAVVGNLDAERDQLKAEVTQLQAQVQAATSAQQHSASDESALRAQLASAQAELLDKNRQIEALAATIQADEKQIAADRVQLAQGAVQRGAQDAQVKQLNETLKQRETTISDERVRLQGLTAELSSDESQIDGLRNQLTQLTIVRGPDASPGAGVHISDRDLGLGTSFGLIIANARYKDSASYQALPAVEKDAEGVKNALARYGFKDHIEPLPPNPSRDEIESALAHLMTKVGANDSILIYFAGHGAIDGGTTYWLPSDADPKNPITWVSTGWISEMIQKTKARHVLVVVDSCYAGAMVRSSDVRLVGNGAAAEPDRIKLLARLPSRTVLTSGGNEPVLSNGPGGNSIFARQFIDMLDQNSGVLDGTTLYTKLVNRVTEAAAAIASLDPERSAQRPRYSALVNAGHLNGDFLFVPTTLATDSHT
jgi:hypothetical protein